MCGVFLKNEGNYDTEVGSRIGIANDDIAKTEAIIKKQEYIASNKETCAEPSYMAVNVELFPHR